MKKLSIPVFLYLILSSVNTVFAQKRDKIYEKSFMPCDTMCLKNGGEFLVKIKDSDGSYVYYQECNDGKVAARSPQKLIHVNNVDSIKYQKLQKFKYHYVPTHVKYFYEISANLNVPRMTSLLYATNLIQDNVYVPPFDIGYTISAGYQFKPYFGLGITNKHDIYIDYTSDKIDNLLADYRLDFGKCVVSVHGGIVTPRTKLGGGDCRYVILDKAKTHPTFGVSIKSYKAKNFLIGLSLMYSKIATIENCYSFQTKSDVIKNSRFDTFNLNIHFGLYAPKRLVKEML